ncbi:hypothetical protein DFH11DRAFT_1614748 [Phellopilus nigrolimitatus]|nr:hypothetical protein DFH11DRAFT_1614748 [Phellopilus nigrolimitatus]
MSLENLEMISVHGRLTRWSSFAPEPPSQSPEFFDVSLKTAWDTLLWSLSKVAISEIAGITLASGGNSHRLDASWIQPLPCSGRLMGEYEVGPFNSKSELAMWFNKALRHAHSMYPYNPPALPFDESAPLVLTHGDLTPRNIILGDDGKVWIIDWGCSGVYPRWFEVSSMVLDSMQPRSWMWASRFAAGWYYRSQEYFAGLTNFTVSIIGFGVPIPFGE